MIRIPHAWAPAKALLHNEEAIKVLEDVWAISQLMIDGMGKFVDVTYQRGALLNLTDFHITSAPITLRLCDTEGDFRMPQCPGVVIKSPRLWTSLMKKAKNATDRVCGALVDEVVASILPDLVRAIQANLGSERGTVE